MTDTTTQLTALIGGMTSLRPREHRAIFDPEFDPKCGVHAYAVWCIAYRACEEQLPCDEIEIYPEHVWIAEQIVGHEVAPESLGALVLHRIREEYRKKRRMAL